MIGIILHKRRYFSSEIPVLDDINTFNIHKLECTKNTKHESKHTFNNKIGISNSKYSSKKILELYQKKGVDLLEELKLEFSFGIYDTSKQIFFGARDRIGVKPFYYYNSNDVFIYSTDIKYIKEQLNLSKLNDNWILSSLTGTIFDKTSTQIDGIKKLAPAHYILVEQGKLRIVKYWELKKTKLAERSTKDILNTFQHKLISAINTRAEFKIGAELSGGIDSSSIVGILAKNKKELFTYTHLLETSLHNKIFPYNDERLLRDKIIDIYPKIKYRDVDASNKGLFYELQSELKRQSVPVSNTLAYLSDSIYNRAQEDGVDILFSGFGGDEGVSNFASILPSQLAKQFKLIALQKAINKPYFSKAFLSHLIYANIPALRKKKKNWRQASYEMLFIDQDFADSIDLNKMYWQYHGNREVKNLDEFIQLKTNENYISNRMEATGASARHRGIEYTFPLLDIDLLSYYYSMPDALKYSNGIGRYAFREIVKEFIPIEIYLKTSKMGATVPNVLARFIKDYKLIEDFLQSVRKGKAKKYINFDKMLENMTLIKQYSEGKKVRTNQHIFFNALMLIMYLEGEY